MSSEKVAKGSDSAHGTHVSFGRRGNKVLVTYHGDHAYAFDVTGAENPAIAFGEASDLGGVHNRALMWSSGRFDWQRQVGR